MKNMTKLMRVRETYENVNVRPWLKRHHPYRPEYRLGSSEPKTKRFSVEEKLKFGRYFNENRKF